LIPQNHSINRSHGGSGHGDKTVSPRYHDGWFFLQAHAELNLRLMGGYMKNMIEEGADKKDLNGMASSHSY
jgi:hypothetical protein